MTDARRKPNPVFLLLACFSKQTQTMKQHILISITVIDLAGIHFSCGDPGQPTPKMASATVDTLVCPQETHFKNRKQIPFAGDNAEAYY